MAENDTPPADTSDGQTPSQPQFALQRLYLKDLSFEAPNGPMTSQDWQPKVSQDLNTEINGVQEGVYEVVLKLTVNVKYDDEHTAFLIEVHQGGLFTAQGIEGQQLQHLLSSQCPQILFPYLREIIDSTIVRGGFPPLMLPPINFDALYMQAVNEARERGEDVDGAPTVQ